MNKRMKGLLTVLIVMAAVGLRLPAHAALENPPPTEARPVSLTEEREVTATGACGDTATYTLYSDGELVISGTGAMANDSSSEYAPWYEQRSTVKKVTVEPGITAICNDAFNGCNELMEVSLPAGVTSLGQGCFNYCIKLRTIDLPESLNTIGACSFQGCYSLYSIAIPEGVTTIGNYSFDKCRSLKYIFFLGDPATVSSSAFNFDEGSYGPANLEAVFCAGASAPKNTNFPAEVHCNVTRDQLVRLVGADDGNGDLVLPPYWPKGADLFVDAVPRIKYRLTSVSAAAKVSGRVVSIPANGVDSLTISGTFEDISNGRGTSGSGYCGDCNSSYTIPGSSAVWMLFYDGRLVVEGYGHTKKYSLTNSAPWKDSASMITSVYVGDGITGLGSYFMGYRTSSTFPLRLPDTLLHIGDNAFDTDGTFFCGVMLDAFPPHLKTIGNRAFKNCYALEKAILSDGLESIGESAFSGCSKLKKVSIPGTVTTIDSYTFYDCTSLTFIELEEGVETLGYQAFYAINYDNVYRKVTILLPLSLTKLGRDAFYFSLYDFRFYYPGTESDKNRIDGADSYSSTRWRFDFDVSAAFTVDVDQTGNGSLVPPDILQQKGVPFTVEASPNGGYRLDGLTLSCEGCTVTGPTKKTSSYSNYSYYYEVTVPEESEISELTISLATTELRPGKTYNSGRTYNGTGLDIDPFDEVITVVYGELSYALYTDGELVLYTNGGMESYLTDDDRQPPLLDGEDAEKVTSVCLEESCDYIDDKWFMDFTNLQYVVLPANTRLVDTDAFKGCTALTDVFYAGAEKDFIIRDDTIKAAYWHMNYDGSKILPVTVETAEHGALTPETGFAVPGETLSFTVTHDIGYRLDDITAVGAEIDGDAFTVDSDAEELVLTPVFRSLHPGKAITASGTFGRDCFYVVFGDDKLYIGGGGDYGSLTPGELPWQEYTDSIRTVCLADTLAFISSNYFNECAVLERVLYGGDKARWEEMVALYYRGDKLDDVEIHYNTDTLDGHYAERVTKPTCRKGGYTDHVCPCGYSYRDSETDRLGHDFSGGACANCGMTPQSMDAVVLRRVPDQSYTGKAIQPELPLYCNGELLVEGVDYQVSYLNNLYPGEAYATVIGMEAFPGMKETRFFIVQADLANAIVSDVESKIYSSSTLQYTQSGFSVSVAGRTLTEGTDYRVSYTHNTMPGTACMILDGLGYYCGRKTVDFLIRYPMADRNLPLEYANNGRTFDVTLYDTVQVTCSTSDGIVSQYKVTDPSGATATSGNVSGVLESTQRVGTFTALTTGNYTVTYTISGYDNVMVLVRDPVTGNSSYQYEKQPNGTGATRCTLTVRVSEPYGTRGTVTGVQILRSDPPAEKGMDTLYLTAEVTVSGPAANTDLTWSSSDTSVATVSSDGTVTLKKPGSTVIRAAAGGKSDTLQLSVDPIDLASVITAAEIERDYNGYVPLVLSTKGPLKKGTDYTASFTEADGRVTAVFTGIGLFSGTASYSFDALPEVTIGQMLSGGDGTPSNPYLISSAADLRKLAELVNGGYSFRNEYLLQTCDIDLGCTDNAQWAPIGGSRSFSGDYTGANYTISGMVLSTSSRYAGLFGNMDSAAINSVRLSRSRVEGGSYSGLIAGWAFNSYLSNCVTDASCTLSVNSGVFIGGIIGQSLDTNVTRCVNHASVLAENGGSVGGIAGSVTEGLVSACRNYGSVTVKGGTGAITCSGGIIGMASGDNLSINQCSNHGAVKATSTNFILSSPQAGGIAGVNSAVVANCYNTGSVATDRFFSGGIAGRQIDGYLAYCYNVGVVTASSGTYADPLTDPTPETSYVLNSYYLKSLCSHTTSGNARTDSQLRDKSSLLEFDFSTVWTYVEGENNGYPVLQTFYPSVTSSEPAEFEKYTFPEDVPNLVVPLTANNNATITLMHEDERVSEELWRFARSPNRLILSGEYLSSLPVGVHKFTLLFAAECSCEMKVVVTDSTPNVFQLRYDGMEQQNGATVLRFTVQAPKAQPVQLTAAVYDDIRMTASGFTAVTTAPGQNRVEVLLSGAVPEGAAGKAFLLNGETLSPVTERLPFSAKSQ